MVLPLPRGPSSSVVSRAAGAGRLARGVLVAARGRRSLRSTCSSTARSRSDSPAHSRSMPPPSPSPSALPARGDPRATRDIVKLLVPHRFSRFLMGTCARITARGQGAG
ncbi:hypothetical protein, partial [Streptomyces buecherae]|uniref:hypothetical protein n=1 Tax=Streptomyces buecherae TaxID=2763006 RepID=UPI001C9AF4F4